MSIVTSSLGLVVRVSMAAVSRVASPKQVIVDIGMAQNLYVADNLKKQKLKYHFSRKDQLISRQHDGWRIAVGRKWVIFTEHYVDKRNELILMCQDA